MRTILDFDYAETASKICCVSDANNLVDFICHVSYSIDRRHMLICSQLISNKCFFQWWNSRVANNASLLALEIYARIPVVPQSLFLERINLSSEIMVYACYQGKMACSGRAYGINVSKC